MNNTNDLISFIHESYGIQRSWIAQEIGVTANTLSRYCKNDCVPPKYVLIAIVAVCNLKECDKEQIMKDITSWYKED